MKFSRRDTSKLILAGAAVVAAPSVVAQSRSEMADWANRLQNDLSFHVVSGCEGSLTLQKFDMRKGRQWQFAAVIQLDWPPGFRRRVFQSVGDEGEAAYRALLNKSLFHFAKAWPGCVV